MRTILFLVLVLLFEMPCRPTAASAAGESFFTGNRRLDYCNEPSESCISYIAGVLDTLSLVGASEKIPFLCPASHIELAQATDVVINYLRAHPEKRQVSAASLAAVALMRAFS